MKSKLPILFLALAVVPGILAADGPATGTNSTPSSAPIVSGGAEYAAVVRNSNGIYLREGGAQLPPYPLVAPPSETPNMPCRELTTTGSGFVPGVAGRCPSSPA